MPELTKNHIQTLILEKMEGSLFSMKRYPPNVHEYESLSQAVLNLSEAFKNLSESKEENANGRKD